MPARASSSIRPLLAIPAGREAEWVLQRVADEADRGVAEIEQVSRRQSASRGVVPDDARHRRDRRGVHIDEYDGNRAAAQCRHRHIGRRQRHHDQPVGSLRLGQGAEVVVALLDRLDVIDDEVELAVGENGVDPAQSFCRLRPREERDDDPDGERPAEAQPSRCGTRREAKLLHHGQDPVARPRVDDILPVQGP